MRLLLLLNNILKNIATMLMRSNNCTYIIISSNDVYYTMLHIRYTTYITNCALNSMYCIDILDNMYLCVYMFNSNLYDNICIVAVLDNTTQSITTLFPSNN